ncbi:hypothetical protein [Streptomyces sp. NPDC001678]|uniref:hypothetical protein n=1 Tax=Streptomyces sp. NPDC001678 TaxID=3364599 RepID=UPI003678B264
MKTDLVGPARRGLVMGLNEAAGYGALAATAMATGAIAALRPVPTNPDHHSELTTHQVAGAAGLTDRALSSASWAGMANDLNDALAWGAFPLLFAAHGLSVARIGLPAALCPAVWGLGQILTGGGWSDRIGRKHLITAGTLVQAAVGVHRLWHDGGFAVGAVPAGTLADAYGLTTAIRGVAAPTAASGLVVALRLYETGPRE